MEPTKQPAGAGSAAFCLSVVMVYRNPGNALWDSGRWDAAGIVAVKTHGDKPSGSGPIRLRDPSAEVHLLWPGRELILFKDEAPAYYHNLIAARPSVFVICREDDQGRLEPFLVTLNYDEAAAFTEVEEEVFSVPMPPEVYRWAEAFVLEHYVPEKRKKRKREDWKKEAR